MAVAFDDPCRSLLSVGLAEVIVLPRLDALSPATHNSVTHFLDGSFITCHPPLLAGRELAGIWLGEGRRELKRLFLDSRKQPLLLLEEDCVSVTVTDTESYTYSHGWAQVGTGVCGVTEFYFYIHLCYTNRRT